MTVQEVARLVMKASGVTQKDIADRAGLASQSTVAMFLQSKSMRVESLLLILNNCGYELVARRADGVGPEYVIGDPNNVRRVAQAEQPAPSGNDAEMEKMFEAFKEWYKTNEGGQKQV